MVIKNKIRLTYAPVHPRYEKDRICGHTFEVLDYYLFFKDLDPSSDIKIIIFDKISKEKILNAYNEKYDLDDLNVEKDIEIRKYNFSKKNIISGNEIWIVTSGFDYGFEQNTKFLVKKIISFECSEHDYTNLLKQSNFYLLRDPRLINSKFTKKDGNVFDYVKKIYFNRFNRFKKIGSKSKNKILVYVNNYLKDLCESDLEFLNSISNELEKDLLFISGTKLSNKQLEKYKAFGELKYAPVENLFNQFDTFIFTENQRNYDCSPRFITECKFYNKKIISLIKTDLGALTRIKDLENLQNLNLKDKDEILFFI